jgi:hypothetical protein
MTEDKNGNPVPRKRGSLLIRQQQRDRGLVETDPTKDDRISRFQKRRMKIGNAKAALESRLTIGEVCSILQEEDQEDMRIAVEAWDKLIQVRLALIAMRGNLNHEEMEQIIKDIGTVVTPFPGVNMKNDE